MEFQIEWLLVLPLFFGLGWMAAQWDAYSRAKDSKKLPKSYFKGLNHLLDQEPDKAIDALIEVAQVDTGTVDLYFSLGHLFTQRGEIERSIRVYQSLIERTDLADAPRHSATLKLGMSFLNGGLFDRAQTCFTALLDTPMADEARIQLLHIYQSQQEWTQAIEIARALQVSGGATQSLALSHYYCELARIAFKASRWDQAQEMIGLALKERPESVRAGMLQGEWHAAQGQYAAAIEQWHGLIAKNPSAMPLLAQAVFDAYEAQGQITEGLNYLFDKALSTGSIDVGQTWHQAYERYGDAARLSAHLDELFAAHPSFNALNRLLNARIKEEETDCESARSRAALIRSLIQNQVKQFSRYRCAHCGFEAAHYYWQCPACTRWETYPPKRLEELTPQTHSRNNPNNY